MKFDVAKRAGRLSMIAVLQSIWHQLSLFWTSKKTFPLYPFLFFIGFVLNLLWNNFLNIPPTFALRSTLLILVLSGLLLRFFYTRTRDLRRAGFILFCFFIYMFLFGYLNRLLQYHLHIAQNPTNIIGLLVVWTIALIYATKQNVWYFVRKFQIEKVLSFIFLVVFVIPNTFLTLFIYHRSAVISKNSQGEPVVYEGIHLESKNRPDIYYIVLDGYGRQDSLEDLFQIDNLEFINFLREKSFSVADQSYTNYTLTIFSLASSLNFHYLSDLPDWSNLRSNASFQEYTKNLISENKTAQLLQNIGYKYITINTGLYYTDNKKSDIYLSPFIDFNLFEQLLFSLTPIGTLSEYINVGSIPSSNYHTARHRINYAFDQLSILPSIQGPKFVFAHIISPHPPFIFDKSGNPVRPDRPYRLADGPYFEGTEYEYISGYVEQIEYINSKMKEVITAILSNSTEPPIIIIQGDHGPGSRLGSSHLDSCLWERTTILNAYFLPDGASDLFYDSISPVNTFRLVFNQYFNTSLPFLENRTYLAKWFNYDNSMIDITETRSSKANCD